IGFPSGGSGSNNYYSLIVSSAGKLRAQSSSANTAVWAEASTALSTGTWYHCVAVFTSATSRTVYLNGTAVSNTTSNTPGSVTETAIGELFNGAITDSVDGSIAYPTIWNVALTSGDVTSLYNSGSGAIPTTVETSNVVSYSPFQGSTPWADGVSTNTSTTTGSPTTGTAPF
ncbi:MAG TPA: LamG-like jellyroll fold domain-containing protein, partial [Bacteroidia bacterium]|nr:LamG-like jellyroll fold domain-containing protein [Bacteroidia bacterium]